MRKLKLRKVKKLAWDLNSAEGGFELRSPSLQSVFMIFPISHPKRRVQYKLHIGHKELFAHSFINLSNKHILCILCVVLCSGHWRQDTLVIKAERQYLIFVTWCPEILNVPSSLSYSQEMVEVLTNSSQYLIYSLVVKKREYFS